MSLPLDPGRIIRARVVAALIHDTQRRRVEPCDGTGMALRVTCAYQGRVTCPLCCHRVTVTLAETGVVRIDPHHRGGAR